MKYFYKHNQNYPDQLVETNLIYTPFISEDNSIFCMHFDHTSRYQTTDLESWLPSRPLFTAEFVKFFFEREVKYLTAFKDYAWAPKNVVIDYTNQKISFDYNGINCNHIVYTSKQLVDYCPDWKEQMLVILSDIVKSGYYKTSLYPHCYYIDNGVLRTFDFYGCVESAYPFVKVSDIKGMIGELSGDRFAAAIQDDLLNVEILFKEALSKYVKWPDDYLPIVFAKLF